MRKNKKWNTKRNTICSLCSKWTKIGSDNKNRRKGAKSLTSRMEGPTWPPISIMNWSSRNLSRISKQLLNSRLRFKRMKTQSCTLSCWRWKLRDLKMRKKRRGLRRKIGIDASIKKCWKSRTVKFGRSRSKLRMKHKELRSCFDHTAHLLIYSI